MKSKTFLILIIIAAVLSLGGYMLTRFHIGKSSESMMGRPLFEEFPVDKIALITIQGPKETVRLKKLENRWVVQSRLNYPADFEKISETVRKLKEAEIGRVFESNEGSRKRLALLDPVKSGDADQGNGLRMIFSDKNGKEIENILLGKSRRTEDRGGPVEGHYLMLQGDPKIYLIDKNFSSLDPVSLEWLETELTDVPAAAIKEIVCMSSDKKNIHYHFERPEKGKDFAPVQFPKGKKIDQSSLNQLAAALASLRMENIADPATLTEPEAKMSNLIEYRLFNGLIYRIFPGDTCSKDDSCYLKIEVAYQKPPASVEEKKDDKKKEQSEKAEAGKRIPEKDLSQEAAKLDSRFKPWTYIIPSWKKDVFVTDVSKLVEETADKKNKN